MGYSRWEWTDWPRGTSDPQAPAAGGAFVPRLADRPLVPQGAWFQELVLSFCFPWGNELQHGTC